MNVLDKNLKQIIDIVNPKTEQLQTGTILKIGL